MQWTRMYDGSYHAVKSTFDRTYSYTVARSYAGKGVVGKFWAVYVNDEYLANARGAEGCTFKGARRRAEDHFYEMASKALANKEGKPPIDLL